MEVRLSRRIAFWLGGATIATLLTVEAAVWAHATTKFWFFSAMSRAFASGIHLSQQQSGAECSPGMWQD